jgi:hypothetical protein
MGEFIKFNSCAHGGKRSQYHQRIRESLRTTFFDQS